jgi:peptide/nickel transport system ATP-binding protein
LIFQDSINALNPTKRIGIQLVELILFITEMSRLKAQNSAIEVLYKIGFDNPHQIMNMYPYQLSGGMLQRISLAMVFVINPKIILADEPTSALDVVSAQNVLGLLYNYIHENKVSLVVTSHQLNVVSAVCQRIIVMYNGKIVEEGNTDEIIKNPLHPYTKKLVCSAFNLNGNTCCHGESVDRLDQRVEKSGCDFIHACSKRDANCYEKPPVLTELCSGRKVACFNVT